MISDEGFVVVPDVLTPSEIASLRLEVDSLHRGRAGTRHILGNPAIQRLAEDPRLVALATRLLDAPVLPFKGTLFDKSPTRNWLVAWHQDLALPMRRRVEVPGWGPWTTKGGHLYALAPAEALAGIVALRVHIDDSPPENGPLRVLPSSHRLCRLSEARIAELARDISSVECVVPAGGVIALRPLSATFSAVLEVPLPEPAEERNARLERASRRAENFQPSDGLFSGVGPLDPYLLRVREALTGAQPYSHCPATGPPVVSPRMGGVHRQA